LRGEPLDLVSRELGIPAARLTTWREAFLAAGQGAWKKPRWSAMIVSWLGYAKNWRSDHRKTNSCVHDGALA
jgi:hypothetical protein